MAAKIPAYNGNGKYVFVSYSHKDSDRVYPIISTLNEIGYNIWYDEGIPLVVDYGETLYRKIKECAAVMLFVSERSVKSPDVDKEVRNALTLGKKVVRINIDDSPLPDAWSYHMPASANYISIDAEPSEFYDKLCQAIAECRSSDSELAARRQSEETEPAAAAQATAAYTLARTAKKSGWERAKEIMWSVWTPVVFATLFGGLMFFVAVILTDMLPYSVFENYGYLIVKGVHITIFLAGVAGAVAAYFWQRTLRRRNDNSPKTIRGRKAMSGITWGATALGAVLGVYLLYILELAPYSLSPDNSRDRFMMAFEAVMPFVIIIVGVVVGIVSAIRAGKAKRKETVAGLIARILCFASAVPTVIWLVHTLLYNLLFY